MNRSESLTLLQANGFDTVMTMVGRVTTDTSGGFGPAIDRAYRIYISVQGLATTITSTDTADADDEGWEWLLRAATYDLVLPFIATRVSISVDAPLTKADDSDLFKHFKALRDDAWLNARALGFSADLSVGGFAVNLDFTEPPDDSGNGF